MTQESKAESDSQAKKNTYMTIEGNEVGGIIETRSFKFLYDLFKDILNFNRVGPMGLLPVFNQRPLGKLISTV